MLFSLLKHYLDTDSALKVSQSVYCFTTSIIIIIIILGSYTALFLLLAQSALHSITPARIASLGNLTYCCHARRRSQYPLKLGTHISPGWREAQTRLTSCPRMLSHMKQLALIISPTPYQLSHMRPQIS